MTWIAVAVFALSVGAVLTFMGVSSRLAPKGVTKGFLQYQPGMVVMPAVSAGTTTPAVPAAIQPAVQMAKSRWQRLGWWMSLILFDILFIVAIVVMVWQIGTPPVEWGWLQGTFTATWALLLDYRPTVAVIVVLVALIAMLRKKSVVATAILLVTLTVVIGFLTNKTLVSVSESINDPRTWIGKKAAATDGSLTLMAPVGEWAELVTPPQKCITWWDDSGTNRRVYVLARSMDGKWGPYKTGGDGTGLAFSSKTGKPEPVRYTLSRYGTC